MFNELIFIAHSLIISIFALIALRLGKEALIGFISVTCILANLFVIKQTTLCTLTATCSDAYSIGAVLGLNLLQEYYGRDMGKKAIWISFFLLIFYGIVTQIHLAYIPSNCDIIQHSYAAILEMMPRIIIASFSVYLLVQNIDSILYAWLKQKFHGNYLVLRNYISIGTCQFLDTALFSFFGLYGLVDNIWHIIVVSYAIKLIAIFLATPCIALSKKISK